MRVEILCRDEYPELLGDKVINARTLNVERTIGELTVSLRPELDAAVAARRRWLDDRSPLRSKGRFPSWEERFADADGNVWTFREIVQGLIDNFHGRRTELAWRLNDRVPVPDEIDPVRRAGLELTGPWYPLSRAIHQINADVVTAFEDEEDASPAWFVPRGSGRRCPAVWEGRRNVKLVLSESVPKPYFEGGKSYEIRKPRSEWPAVFHRLPGIHLLDHYVLVDGRPAPAIVVSATVYLLNNYDALRRAGSGVYFYVPKVMTPEEALVVERMLRSLERAAGLRTGEIKVAMLYEEGMAGLYLPVILWIWRERLIKSSNGRWDYLGSLIEMWKDESVFPDPQNVTMTSPNMMVYQRYNALLMLMAGMTDGEARAAPVGGMAAVMLYPQTDYYGRHRYNARAIRGIWIDKLRERLTGLIFVAEDLPEGAVVTLRDVLEGRYRGRLYDLFRQSWVATKEEQYVAAGNAPLRARLEELQGLIDAPVEYVEVEGQRLPAPGSGLTPEERRRFAELGLLTQDGKIKPWTVRASDLSRPEDLFSERLWGGKGLWEALYSIPQGEITVEHIQHAFYMAANYAFQILNGNLAAAIDDYELNQRFMNDLATYRIFTAWLWSLYRNGARVTRDGYLLGPERTKDGVVLARRVEQVPKGTRFDETLFRKVWELHYEWTRAFYDDLDSIAAERVVKSLKGRAEPELVSRVKEVLRRAYASGPFAELSAEEAAKQVSEKLGVVLEEAKREVVANAPRFDRSRAPLVMEFLRALITSPRYVQHNARLLFAAAEMENETALTTINLVLGSSPDELEEMVREGRADPKVLELYRYVHDFR
ncbi:MAG: malate synthase [Thaumarchaeota archaeon]|nr:malate synthase [Candidatus Calditenuaceae archaeon]MDW8043067.1 malate synthase [Nitrososphaerota archaeon]